ncbi:MAG: helix-turn-helix domain-containing protein [Rhodoferax sp.]|nr:helix-turn-helix domain-containing protein [Rhodoferax sp.]MDP3654284.1 helix-turn-helix domain-containing protein [Rhodoferax sp.]
MNDVLNEAEVAEILDCEPKTVQEKARLGELPAVKFGRSWRFPRTALLEALHAKALANKPKPALPKAVQKTVVRRLPPALPQA